MAKTLNGYADALGDLYARTPKAVFAAIAVSGMTNGGDDLEEARQRITDEWDILHMNGIVPQPAPRPKGAK